MEDTQFELRSASATASPRSTLWVGDMTACSGGAGERLRATRITATAKIVCFESEVTNSVCMFATPIATPTCD